MTTGAAATSRSVNEYTGAATRSNTTPTKNTKMRIDYAYALYMDDGPGRPVEVETESMDELNQALSAGADIIMLDNFSPEDLKDVAARIKRS